MMLLVVATTPLSSGPGKPPRGCIAWFSVQEMVEHASTQGLTMNHETAVANAKEVADRVLAPAARQNDKEAGFSSAGVNVSRNVERPYELFGNQMP